MYLYVIKVKANLPYPIEKEYRIECWKLWTAISRGIKLFRADQRVQRKRLLDVAVQGYRVGGRIERYQDMAEPLDEVEDFVEEEVLPEAERKRIEDTIAKAAVTLKKGGE